MVERQWAGGRTAETKYRMPKSQRPDGAVAGSTKSLASRYNQLKTGHDRTGQYLQWVGGPSHRPVLVVSVPHANERPPLQGVSGMEDVVEDSVGGSAEEDREVEKPVKHPGSSC